MTTALTIPEGSRRRSVGPRLAVSAAIILSVLLGGLVFQYASRHRDARDEASEAFYGLFDLEVPATGVVDVQGYEHCGQDCTAWLRFRLSSESSGLLRAFQPAGCEALPSGFLTVPRDLRFQPGWGPQVTASSLCFTKEKARESFVWRVWLMHDTQTKTAHAVGGTYPR